MLSERLAFEIYYIELWHIFSVLFILIVNFYIYLKSRKNSLLYSYIAVQSLLLIWMVSKIFKTVSPDVDIRWLFIVTQYFGNCFLGPAFFAFAYNYAKGKLPNKKVLIAISIPSFFFFLAMATNPLHMLFYSYYDYYKDSFGPFFYIHQTYTYLLMIVGFFLCAKQFFYEKHYKRIQSVIIALAVLVPLLVNVFYILKLFKPVFGFRPLFDITPIACNISLLLFAIATFRYRFFDITAIAWRKVFNQIPEGIVLLNKYNTITDMNNAFISTTESTELTKTALDVLSSDGCFAFMHTTATERHFKVSLIPLSHNQIKKGHLIRFIDDTQFQNSLQSLSDKTQALQNINRILSAKASAKRSLAVYKTRNFIGREVHDVLGHSIVLALSILEVVRISYKNDFAEAKAKLAQAIAVINNARDEMDNTLLKSPTRTAAINSSLVAEIERLVNETSQTGQNVSLTIQGDVYEVQSHIKDAVFRLCQEAVTNAIRHGKAEKIDIILRFYNLKIEIYIIDNGIGCSQLKKGYGLSGMEERIVSDIGGVLNYGSLENGFTISAAVPI